MDNNQELYHWGIKGMKWGVRRFQNKDGTLTPEGKERLAKMEDAKIAAEHYKNQRDDTDKELYRKLDKSGKLGEKKWREAVRKGYKGDLTEWYETEMWKDQEMVDLQNQIDSTTNKYLDLDRKYEAGRAYVSALILENSDRKVDRMTRDGIWKEGKDAVDDYLNNTNKTPRPSNNAEHEKKKATLSNKVTALEKQIKNAKSDSERKRLEDEKDEYEMELLELVEQELDHSAIFNATPDELYHWGIPGMKWGRRRYQNKDGSLTPEGRKRYGDDDPNESTEQKRERLLKSTNAQELYKNRNLLTTQEINDRLNRINTEQRLADLAAKDVKAGKSKLDKVLEVGGKLEQVYNFCQKPMMKAVMKQLGLSKADEALRPTMDQILKNPSKYKSSVIKEVFGVETNVRKMAEWQKSDKAAKEKLAKELADKLNKADDNKPSDSQNGNSSSTPKNNTQSNYTKSQPFFKPNPKSEQEKVNEARDNRVNNSDDTPISKGILYDRTGNELLNQFTDTKAVDIPPAKVDTGKKYTDEYLKNLRSSYGAAHADSSEGELYHYGVKGMKWGVRKRSRINKDSGRLSKVASKYYDAVNKRNALLDTGGWIDDDFEDYISRSQRSTQKLVNKLQRKYKTVSVVPEFEKNGYVVKNIEVMLEKVDRLGRVRMTSKSSKPIATYNQWRDEMDPNVSKAQNKIIAKYNKKLASATTQEERELLELDMWDELNEL